MFLHEMNNAERTTIQLFEECLERAGWDLEPVKSLLHSGTWMSPEGSADLNKATKELALDLYLQDRAFLFTIEGQNRRLQFYFTYKASIESILDWIITSQNEIDPQTFADYLRLLIPLCEQVFFLTSDGKRYQLTLEDLMSITDESDHIGRKK